MLGMVNSEGVAFLVVVILVLEIYLSFSKIEVGAVCSGSYWWSWFIREGIKKAEKRKSEVDSFEYEARRFFGEEFARGRYS